MLCKSLKPHPTHIWVNGTRVFGVCVCVCTSSAAAHKAQVVESGHLVLEGGRGVTKLSGEVLVVSRHHRNQGAVRGVAKGNHLETWKKIVGQFEMWDVS